MARITLAGEDLIAQKQAAQQPLNVTRFIFANVPGLNPNNEVDRAAPKPLAAQIVYSAEIPPANKGYVNPAQVVYSLQVGSDVGDWDFNWIGLESAEGVLFAVAYVPLQQKRRNIPPLQLGNNITRNFLVVFDGAQALTGVTIDASTWQHDFTVRLAGIDERERQSNRDIFGRACFFGSALQLEKVGGTYQLKPGTAYVEGVRLQQALALPVVPPALPTTAWLDVALQRELNDVVATWSVVWGAGKVDYVDSAGVQHYCVAIADLPNSNTITDSRPVENIAGPLVAHFAARVGDYAELRARSTTKDDVGLGNLPNAKSDDPASNSSEILATTKMVQKVREYLAPIESPTLIGAPKAPTATMGSSDTSIATTGFIQQALGAVLTKNVAGGDSVMLSADEASYPIILLTGALTDSTTLVMPAISRKWLVANRTTGAFLLTVKTEAGEGVIVPSGSTQQLYCDGAAVGIVGDGPASVPHGYISGLEISNNSAAPTNRIDLAPGIASNHDGSSTLRVNSTLTKVLQSTGGWSSGEDGNGLFVGAVAINTWYHAFLIRNDLTGAVDLGFDTSITAHNRPAGYGSYRRLGSIKTDSNGTIIPFLQLGRTFEWLTPILDAAVTNHGSSATALYRISVPIGLRVRARLSVGVRGSDAGGYVTAGDFPTVLAAIPLGTAQVNYQGGFIATSGSTDDFAASEINTPTNTQSQIKFTSLFNAPSAVRVVTYGWSEEGI